MNKITSQNKMSNNFETVRDTQKMSMSHDYETGVAFSDSVNKTCVKRPLASGEIIMTSHLVGNETSLSTHPR